MLGPLRSQDTVKEGKGRYQEGGHRVKRRMVLLPHFGDGTVRAGAAYRRRSTQPWAQKMRIQPRRPDRRVLLQLFSDVGGAVTMGRSQTLRFKAQRQRKGRSNSPPSV